MATKAEHRKAYYEKNKEKERRKHLEQTYGISPEDYEVMLQIAKFKCELCGCKPETGRRMSVDHSHKTGKVRGILCQKCNAGLGMLQDNPYLLRKAANYIEEKS